ncbi:11_t:CDS:2 [Ambispora gerdemannii]|uniref:11_t:CDS:1 n=1 Tax=Ambispora gerdemannii TaxID=144530 RepID=A0A9N9CYH6_9GLOM|nr:11_t:CDS:2 [Ambispora gerdemannii]
MRKGARVIDLGCGAGTWILVTDFISSLEMISPIFPTEGLPLNVEFIECNILDGLPYKDASFDFIHQKFLTTAFTQAQWEEKAIPEITRLTRPDGWVEIVEGSVYLISDGNATKRISEAAQNFLKSKGMNITIGEDIPRLLENTNAFSEIKYKKKAVVLGKKGGKSGEETLRFYIAGFGSVRIVLSSNMNLMPEHYDALVETISIEAEKTTCTTYVDQYRICGHKK